MELRSQIDQPRAAPPPSVVDVLACPMCKAGLSYGDGELRCRGCSRTYGVRDSGVAVLLPDEAFVYETSEAARGVKTHVRDRFAAIDRSLPQPHADFATFLNLGYVPNGNPGAAVRGPGRPIFNPFSTRLLFEVLGACSLDGRVVLDLGTGRGGATAMIDRYYTPRTIVGLDLSPANVEFCQQHHALRCGGFAVGDVEYLPVRDMAADVVINLESSHYYPHVNRFYAETYRALRPGGDFLYADILPTAAFESAIRYLTSLGFVVTRDDDVTANVLLSCEAVAAVRGARRMAGLYDAFLVLPGSPEFEGMRGGRLQYRILGFRRA